MLKKIVKKKNLAHHCKVNTLNVICEYSCSNRENLTPPIQMQLSEKPKPKPKIFYCTSNVFGESSLNFEHQKKEPPIA